ncbi:hypothetical protein, partial [Tritonibacter mobilis]|uniref:hypothetical protein n=1 Tax=Tritonibacter mobilis TaxID=379347 RepID=UPI001403EA6F
KQTAQSKLAYFYAALMDQFCTALDTLRRSFPEQTADRSRDDLHSMVAQVVQRMSVYGIRKLRSIHVLASWQLFFGERFEQRDPAGQLIQMLASHLDEDAKLAQLERRMDALHETGAL